LVAAGIEAVSEGDFSSSNNATKLSFKTGASEAAAEKVAISSAGNLSLTASNTELRFYEGSNYVGFEAPALSADKIWVLPSADGSSDQVLKTNGSGTLSWTSVSGSPSGSITMYGGSSAPTDWLFCNGAAVSRSTYSALFSVIGTTYGAGDGSSTFNLPDFGGKGPMGYKSDNSKFDALAETVGEETHTLTTAEMPTHTIYSSTTNIGTGTTQGQYTSVAGVNTTTIGSGNAHNILDPYLTVNFIVKI